MMNCPLQLRHVAALTIALLAISAGRNRAQAQSLFSGGGRPFVVGFTPVIGPGGRVGGVDVDANGVLGRVQTQTNGQLGRTAAEAMRDVSVELQQSSSMRKISLRRLESEIAKRLDRQGPLPPEVLFLAGLQRVEYVFAYPEAGDIVIAGPADGWEFRGQDVVGTTSGDAVLRLDDLVDALQATSTDEGGNGITCSIDPTEEGMRRLQRLLRSRNVQLSDAALEEMEQQVGDQIVSVTGVRPNSHFARVLVSADFLMKRIAMDLDRSPVAGLPSYMRMLHGATGRAQLSAPRWWMAANYDSVEKSEDALAWRFRGPGIKALSEHGYLNARGDLVNAGHASPLGKLWADKFTNAYDELGKQLPVFSQLRGCVDLAVVGTLITNESLLDRSECQLPLLMDPNKVRGEEFPAPTCVKSHASFVRGRRGVVVSVSGGVDLAIEGELENAVVNPKLFEISKATENDSEHWWWD